MYRLIVESLLGLTLEVDQLRFAPCLPADWKEFTVHYRYRETVYHIVVRQTPAGSGERTDTTISLVDDGQEHRVEIKIPAVR
jgi:cellobiose phosphorylase